MERAIELASAFDGITYVWMCGADEEVPSEPWWFVATSSPERE